MQRVIAAALVLLVCSAAAQEDSGAPFGPNQHMLDSLMALPDSAWDIPPYLNREDVIRFMRRMARAPESTFAGPDTAHRTDAEMTRLFYGHAKEFETLLRMFQRDSTVNAILGPRQEIYQPPSPLPPARQAEYDRLLSRLQIRMLVRESRDLVLMRTTTVHTFDRKGYAWSRHRPAPLIETETTRDPSGHFRVYRPLKRNWYIYFQPNS